MTALDPSFWAMKVSMEQTTPTRATARSRERSRERWDVVLAKNSPQNKPKYVQLRRNVVECQHRFNFELD